MYKPGDIVVYKTSKIRTIHRGEVLGQTKTGVIEEAFTTFDNRPCYWIKKENELIMQTQIIGKANLE